MTKTAGNPKQETPRLGRPGRGPDELRRSPSKELTVSARRLGFVNGGMLAVSMATPPPRSRRQHRAQGSAANYQFLGVRLRPENFRRLDDVAAALGISKAALVDAMVDAVLSGEQLDDVGRPLWWVSPVPRDQQELPLTRTA